jgi:hypothetical protein
MGAAAHAAPVPGEPAAGAAPVPATVTHVPRAGAKALMTPPRPAVSVSATMADHHENYCVFMV